MPRTRITQRTRRLARVLRAEPTEAERRLWRALDPLRRAGIPLRRQASIGPYIADIAALSLKLVIEIDGGQHADSTRDVRRTQWLQDQGYRVIRLWNSEILENIEGCVTTIAGTLEEQRQALATGR